MEIRTLTTFLKVAETQSFTQAAALLGYSQSEINVALKGIDMADLTLEQIIKQALKKMMKN